MIGKAARKEGKIQIEEGIHVTTTLTVLLTLGGITSEESTHVMMILMSLQILDKAIEVGESRATTLRLG